MYVMQVKSVQKLCHSFFFRTVDVFLFFKKILPSGVYFFLFFPFFFFENKRKESAKVHEPWYLVPSLCICLMKLV